MQRFGFIATLAVALLAGGPALACRVRAETVLADVRYADLVLVGRISNYRIIRDEAFRRRMLDNPNLPARQREIYSGPGSLLTDYARFNIEVDEVLVGHAPRRVSVTWDNSTFGEPATLPDGRVLIALRRPSSTPPLRGPSATFNPSPDPRAFTVLQAPCADAFIFENSGESAHAIRRILNASGQRGRPDAP